MITALGAAVTQQLINLLDAQGPARPIDLTLINNNLPTYTAFTDYTETIDGVLITYLTTHAVKACWEITLFRAPKHVHALQGEGITYPMSIFGGVGQSKIE